MVRGITEPSAVAPDAGINVGDWIAKAPVFSPEFTTNVSEVDFGIRRYRARFCKERLV